MWSSVLGAVALYLLSCKSVFIHAAIHFEIYVAKLLYVTFVLQLAFCLISLVYA